jgi:hypothetical protein
MSQLRAALKLLARLQLGKERCREYGELLPMPELRSMATILIGVLSRLRATSDWKVGSSTSSYCYPCRSVMAMRFLKTSIKLTIVHKLTIHKLPAVKDVNFVSRWALNQEFLREPGTTRSCSRANPVAARYAHVAGESDTTWFVSVL